METQINRRTNIATCTAREGKECGGRGAAFPDRRPQIPGLEVFLVPISAGSKCLRGNTFGIPFESRKNTTPGAGSQKGNLLGYKKTTREGRTPKNNKEVVEVMNK